MTDPGFGILKSELIWEKGEGHVGSCCDRIILVCPCVGRGSSGYRRARATRQTQAGANPLVKHLRGKTFFAARFYAGFLGRTILNAIEHPSPDFRK